MPASTRQEEEREQSKRGASLCDLLRWENELKAHNHYYKENERHEPPRICRDCGKIFEAAHQVSPGRHRLHHPEPQDAQVRFGQNEQWDGNPELRIEKRTEVWRNMAQQEPHGFTPRGASEEQEIGISDATRSSANDAN